MLGAPHYHSDFFQVFKVLEGRGVLHIGNQSFDANVGGVFWLPPKTVHWSEDPPNPCPRMIELRFRRVARAPSAFALARLPHHIASDRHPEVLTCFNAIVREFSRQKPFWEWQVSAMLNEFIALLARAVEMQRAGENADLVSGYRVDAEGIARAVSYIHENYFRPMSLGTLARIAGMSVNRFGKLFRGMEETSPIDYLIEFRLRRAAELAAERRLTLTQIASAVGFSSVHHYSHCHKKRFGVPPSGRTKK
jgi:AraC-like DNA-binding protein